MKKKGHPVGCPFWLQKFSNGKGAKFAKEFFNVLLLQIIINQNA